MEMLCAHYPFMITVVLVDSWNGDRLCGRTKLVVLFGIVFFSS